MPGERDQAGRVITNPGPESGGQSDQVLGGGSNFGEVANLRSFFLRRLIRLEDMKNGNTIQLPGKC